MNYFQLFLTFIVLTFIAIGLTYTGGITAGALGCVLLSLHNVWASGLILTNDGITSVIIFIQNMIVCVPIMLLLDQVFIFFRTGEVELTRLSTYLILAIVISTLMFKWYQRE